MMLRPRAGCGGRSLGEGLLDGGGDLFAEQGVAVGVEVDVVGVLGGREVGGDGGEQVVGGDAVLFHEGGGGLVAFDNGGGGEFLFGVVGDGGRRGPDEGGAGLLACARRVVPAAGCNRAAACCGRGCRS